MSIPSAEELRLTKQPIATEKLVRWAEEAGFETRRSKHGTSHIRCRHSVYRDITFGLVINSKQLGSQRSFSDALKVIRSREAAKQALQTAFEKSGGHALAAQYERLPSYLKAEHDYEKGHTIIRDRVLPQIGMTVKFEDAHMLENKVRFLDDNKRDIYLLLNRHDIRIDTASRRSANRILYHPVYEIPPVLVGQYQPGEKADAFFNKITAFVEQVFDRDQSHFTRLKNLLSMPFVSQINVTSPARRGDRTNAVTCTLPFGGSLAVNFASHSTGRIKPVDGVLNGRVSEKELADLERRMTGLARAHAKAKPAFA